MQWLHFWHLKNISAILIALFQDVQLFTKPHFEVYFDDEHYRCSKHLQLQAIDVPGTPIHHQRLEYITALGIRAPSVGVV